ncbi:TRAP transporter large permease [Vreelandella boliviensis]|uniref:TRAP transporter large permease protein n=1 Tax=Vreelandella boliviensis LC1 TaxID=1072583 RepID=A0A265E0U5_9GAMM|nr:TRAP transporter large permease [Halomonas boliviensis]EHJ92812.1 Putative TRAP transporter large permease protein [Halomonas boliviensis LC1]OZT75213.1 TRAP transporter large permease [Halomonas boliviensis LC1]
MNLAIGSALIALFALSIPIAVAIALTAVIGLYFFSSVPLMVVPQRMFVGLDSFPLMAVPFFILAGHIMSNGGIATRMVEFARSLVGGIQGGLACTCVVTCMMFAAISGSSVATTFAIGAILIPAMVARGYPPPMAASIQASSSELGIIIPPSVPLILYGVSTETSITQLFLAGFGPGLLIGGALIVMVIIWCRIKDYGTHDGDLRSPIWPAFRSAFLALLMPVIIIGGIYGGIFTPTEASAVAVLYGLFLGMVVYRTIKLSDLPRIFRESALSAGSIMLIIAAASILSFVIGRSGLASDIGVWAQSTFDNRYTFLLAINMLLLVVGMFIETSAAILILAPILAPIAIGFGIDPVHFGIVIVVNLALGMFTPPLGVNLFAAAQVAKLPVEQLFRFLLSPVLTIITCLMLITYVPMISLFLRDLLF